jgi:hypothetical protein
LNVSEYRYLRAEETGTQTQEICEQVRSGEMPLPSYLIIHRESALAPSEIDAICAWTDGERKKLLSNRSCFARIVQQKTRPTKAFAGVRDEP